ncbi:MAG: hypothetical protein JWP85_984 [Rhodoglobus sp.]|nr:hypothetical protein [Rhodoglobus sp.]
MRASSKELGTFVAVRLYSERMINGLKYGDVTYMLSGSEFNANLEARIEGAMRKPSLVWMELADGSKTALGFPTGVAVVVVAGAPDDYDPLDSFH